MGQQPLLSKREQEAMALMAKVMAEAAGTGEGEISEPDMEKFAIGRGTSLLDAIVKEVEDPRCARGTVFKFRPLMLGTFLAVLTGRTSPTDIAAFFANELMFINSFVDTRDRLPRAPSRLTIARLMANIDYDQLEPCLDKWMKANFPDPAVADSEGRVVRQIDGKACRAVAVKAYGERTMFYLNYSEHGDTIRLAIEPVGIKGNELSHLPPYMRILPKNGIYTFDAMGTNDKPVAVGLEQGVQMMLTLKENQRCLYSDLYDHRLYLMATPDPDKEGVTLYDSIPSETFRQQGHGRIETRVVRVIQREDLPFLASSEGKSSPVLRGFILNVAIVEKTVVRRVKGKQVSQSSLRFYLSNIPDLTPEMVVELRSKHWAIEMAHWQLDNVLGEDRKTNRMGDSTRIGCMLRRFVLMMHKRDPEYSSRPLADFLRRNNSTCGIAHIAALINLDVAGETAAAQA